MSLAISDSLVEVPNGRVFVRVWRVGSAEESPIILLHDSLGSVDQWRDFPAELATVANRDVLAYDRLGFGRSSRREGRPSVDFIREEAEGYFPLIVRAFSLDAFVLFGHSVGGAMALTIAASQGSGCEGVITESAQAFVEERTVSGISAAKERFSDPRQYERLARWHGDKAEWVLDAWTGVWLSEQFSTWSLDPFLGEVRCCVLAIHGGDDEFGSVAFPRRIVSGVKGPTELAILANCGHVPHREMRDEVLRLTSGFLKRHCPRRGAAG